MNMTNNNNLPEKVRQVKESGVDVFAQAIAAGTAAVPFAGRMIDVPVDEWAEVVIATSAACRVRDAEKQSALEAASA